MELRMLEPGAAVKAFEEEAEGIRVRAASALDEAAERLREGLKIAAATVRSVPPDLFKSADHVFITEHQWDRGWARLDGTDGPVTEVSAYTDCAGSREELMRGKVKPGRYRAILVLVRLPDDAPEEPGT